MTRIRCYTTSWDLTIERLEARLVRAEKVIAVQGNASALLRELSLESAEQKDGR